MNKVGALVDTDVILDYLTDRKPYSDYAHNLFIELEAGKFIGYLTPVIISNTYYILRKLGSHKRALSAIGRIMQIFEVSHISKSSILTAINSGFNDFEDALQNYSAEENEIISVVITRNRKDFKKSNLSIMSPEDFTTYLHAS